ncbi:MAG: flagellar hook-associated protein FlgL [Phycisphaerales bacterium]|nr:flagellar hook-associated protein FlgL [Phycisphaerales bacterium]
MAVSPINVTRVSHNLRTMSLLQSLRQNTTDLFNRQTQLATGRRFNSIGEDPVGAAQALRLRQSLGRQDQILDNLRHADLMLTASDDALTEVNSLLAEAQAIGASSIGAQAGPDERVANASLIASIRERLMAVGNTQVQGRYLFAGRDTQTTPYVSALGGVAYVGDTGEQFTQVSESEQGSFSVPGQRLFGGFGTAIISTRDLEPELTEDTRLEDVGGATGQGIRRGTIIIGDAAGASMQVDLSHADTVGDVIDMVNDAADQLGLGSPVQLDGGGLSVTGSGINIRDTSTGQTASDLGIVVSADDPLAAVAPDLTPRLTPNSPIGSLNAGVGATLEDGFRITVGPRTVTIDLDEVETVQDVLNKINTAGVFVTARINDAGTAIEITSRLAGVAMSISENGGTTAAELGILTFAPDTPVAMLNSGRGLETVEGEPDLMIAASNGDTVEVNLDGVETLGDVVEMINQAAEDAGVTIEAGFSEDTNGIVITDSTGGAGRLTVTRASIQSFAVDDLGLNKTAAEGEEFIVSDDVAVVRPDGLFTALIDLETALASNDERGITDATGRLQTVADDITREHGVVGSRARSMSERVEQTENAVTASQALLSDIEDLDYTEAVTRFQQAQTALQANLLSGSQLLNLSLLDFLG